MVSTVITIEPSVVQKKIRVAAYCRVSSSSDDQLHSFAAQVQYYTKFIRSNDQMELVDIYADEGLTGTKTTKRDEFNRMVADCKKGRIDRVLTKSLSRFARNTADALMYARILRENGVSILFEKENIDTAFMSSELLLALSGAQAQEESISISKNMRWSIERRMKNGTFIPSSTPYGYRLENGQFVIVEDEAKIIRRIFDSYLSGMGKKEIADNLNSQNIPKRKGYETWWETTINYILRNERYIGDALFQKYCTTETLPFTNKRNHGQKPQYYVEETNPAIISKEDFYAVQDRLKNESKTIKNDKTGYPLRRRIICSCGQYYKRKVINRKTYWVCRKHDYDANKCNSCSISEKDIYNAFVDMVNKLRIHSKSIISDTLEQTERLCSKASGTAEKIREIDRSIAELTNKNLVLARLNSKGIMRTAEYIEKSGKLNTQISNLRAERRKLLQQDEDGCLSGLRQLEEIIQGIKEPLTDFDEDLFGMIVKQITVPTRTSLSFELIGGIKLTEPIPEQTR